MVIVMLLSSVIPCCEKGKAGRGRDWRARKKFDELDARVRSLQSESRARSCVIRTYLSLSSHVEK